MKLDNNKQESSNLKVFGVGPKDSEIKSEDKITTYKNTTACFAVGSSSDGISLSNHECEI